MKILVVDDVLTNRKLLCAILEAENHVTIEAGDGFEALERLEAGPVDAIISDILMPRMDGYRLCFEVRKSPRFQHLPFLFHTSSYTSPSDEKLALEMGADCFLTKPAPVREIIKALRQAVAMPRRMEPAPVLPERELNLMKEYNQQLVAKLEEKNAELTTRNEELVRSEQRLDIVTESMTEGLILADLDGQMLRWNRAALEMHGLGDEGEWRRRLRDFTSLFELRNLDGDVLPPEEWPLARIARREPVRHAEVLVRRLDSGWEKVFSYSGGIARELDGREIAFLTVNDVTERWKTESRLRLLSTCVSNLNDIVIVTEAEPLDEPGPRIVLANEALTRLTGYTVKEALGRSPRFLQGEGTDRRVLAEIRQALVEKRPIRRQLVNYGKDGVRYWLDIDIVPIFSPGGKCTHFAAIQRDITADRTTREQLLWKTAFFEAQVHSARDGILVVDKEGHKIVQNQRMLELWNFPPELADEIDDRRRLEWVTSQVRHPQAFAEKVAYLYAHPDEISQDEIELLDGRVFERYSAPVRDRDGNHYGRIWTFRDVTEARRAALQIAEQANFLDEARDAILVRDLEGNIIFWNKGAERIYGWDREEALGRPASELLYTDPKVFDGLNAHTLQNGEWQGELAHHTKDGRELAIEARWTLIRDADGQPRSVLAINTDITEKKKIEKQFMRAQRMESIGTLAGGIAHDLNNILAPIMISIEVLKSYSTHPKAAEILETIEVSTRRGADIVRQVLSFARGLEGERIEVQPKHLLKDLGNIIKDTFPKDVRLRFQVPNDIWTILGDPTQIHQILLNLCVNARDAMPHGGSLSISAENRVLDEQYAAMNIQARPGRYVCISVTDTGTGIPASLLEKIFEPFFTTKEVNKGTGLGLSTVMAIVKSHEGTVNVYSEPGKGTTFRVYLPAMEISGQARRDESGEANLPRGRDETILVVDDESSILTITQQTLQAFGYRVQTATNGADAVALYAQQREQIALVLTDMRMPIMDGPAMIHALVRLNPKVKIIAASGLNAEGGQSMPAVPGVKHFLTKPYTAGTLLTTIRAYLDEPNDSG